MLKSITLQNFKSFGARQTVPLEPISVLVGPNNSGKSNFLSVGGFVRRLLTRDQRETRLSPHVFHQPVVGKGDLGLGWEASEGVYHGSVDRSGASEERAHAAGVATWTDLRDFYQDAGYARNFTFPFFGLEIMSQSGQTFAPELSQIARSFAHSRDVKLSLDALRADSDDAGARLGSDGANLAAVVNRWRSADPERNEQLEAVIRSYVPEIRRVLAPAQTTEDATHFRLLFEQTDGQKFDARQVSDGVLFFTGLVAHVIAAGQGALILIEEPENSIHPRRLHDVVELLRRMHKERSCQFVIATHSPVLLDEFRDEPESILLFRRSEQGTVVRPLTEVDRLRDALGKTDPGEMLAQGFFNEPF